MYNKSVNNQNCCDIIFGLFIFNGQRYLLFLWKEKVVIGDSNSLHISEMTDLFKWMRSASEGKKRGTELKMTIKCQFNINVI